MYKQSYRIHNEVLLRRRQTFQMSARVVPALPLCSLPAPQLWMQRPDTVNGHHSSTYMEGDGRQNQAKLGSAPGAPTSWWQCHPLGLKTITFVNWKFSWFIPYFRLKGKAQPGHVALGKVPGALLLSLSMFSLQSTNWLFSSVEQRSGDGGRKVKKNPGVSGHLTPTLTLLLKDIMSSQVYSVRVVSSWFRAIPIIYTQGYFHWGLPSCWHVVCNLLFISNQSKHLKLYGKKTVFHMWRKWVVPLSNKRDYEGENIGN